jgi:subtilisin family serine protease
VGVGVFGLVLGAVQAAGAAPPREEEPGGAAITLITGDRVTIAGEYLSVRPGEGRERMTFSRFSAGGHTYVIPRDAAELVANGRLDRRLFDLTTLTEFGYDDAHRDSVPLIVTHPAGQKGFRLGGVSRDLPSINGVAVAADKSGTTWESLTGARTASTVWLDGKRAATLDHSVPQIGAPAAWAAGYTGAGVTVAVIDTGVDQTHPDLAGREIAEANFAGTPDNVDHYGHGTHVASTVAGTGAKSGGRYRGVADGVSILDVKVLDDFGFGSDSGIIAGMEWAARQGADIANLSFGNQDTPQVDPVEQAVESLTAQYGTLFVVAAGNDGPSAGTILSPGSAPSALTVGGVDRADQLYNRSSRGPTVGDGAIKPDITAPGVEIVAAKAAEGQIGTPAEDGYVSLSGTSMATPHVAGSAALLRQEHPDWTGQQIKAALSASATPTAGLTAFEQGAGRVDVARAITQTVVSEPTSVSLGVVAWPHDDDQPVTRTLTYRNLGTADLTLDLTVDGDAFSVSADTVTVPAGGTASVDITGDIAHVADGVHTATVVATAGDAVTRTPVTITREDERYDLTLHYVDENGVPTGHHLTTTSNLDTGATDFLQTQDGTVVARLPKGRYVVNHFVYAGPDSHEYQVAQPGVVLDRDRTFDIDPRIAKPVSITPPVPATLRKAELGFQVAMPDGRQVSVSYISDIGLDMLSTAQLGDPVPDTRMTGWVNTHWLDANGTQYSLAWFRDRYPTGFTATVGRRELATVQQEFGRSPAGERGTAYLSPQPPTGSLVTVAFGPEVALPSTRTVYVRTEGVRWRSGLGVPEQFFPEVGFTSPPRSYRAGRTYRETFNRPVFGPGLPPADTPWLSRSGDTIAGRIPLFTDGGGNAGVVSAATGTTRLYRGGQLVGEVPTAGGGDFPNLPTASGDYRLTTEATLPAPYDLSTTVSAEWTFSSSHVDGAAALPLNVVRFLPELDADGAAPAGRAFSVPLRFQDETGAFERPRNLTVEVSYDEGGSWQRVPVTPDMVAKPHHPAGATSVSLRASATDRDGNTVRQTVIRAYRLA